jgi:hypothetical protein
MKKLNLFWKIMLIVLPLTTTAACGILSYKLFVRLYGRNGYTETLSRSLKEVYYRNGYVRVLNTQTRSFVTPKLDWITDADCDDSLTVFSYKGKRGYLSLYNGKITIPAQYQAAWLFSEGLGAVIKDNNLGFINSRGQVEIPFQFFINPVPGEKVDFLFKNGYCSMLNPHNKHGLINKKGEWVVQPDYDYIRNPKHGFRVITKDRKSGLLDSLLNMVLPVEYDAITIADDGLVVAKEGLQQKLSFDTQTVIHPFVYDGFSIIYYNSGQVNKKGEDIQLKSDYLTFGINSKIGLMDKNGKIILRALYNDISALANDLFSCKLGEHYVILNGQGQEVKH